MNRVDRFSPRPDLSLAAQFAAVASWRADAVAVVHGNFRLTYAELERRSAILAGRIVDQTEPDSLVGVCLPPGVDAVVAIVSTIRAGRSYVPVDPAYPAERLRYLVEDARLDTVVVDADTGYLAGRHATTIDVNADRRRPSALPESTMDTPAYVIYTSGSSGRPKGVVVTHANVATLLWAGTRLFSFDADDVWTLFHSISFDFSVWEMWGALLNGARLIIVDNETKMAPDQLVQLLETERVTIFNVVPSVFREIAAEFVRRPRTLALRYLIFGGEPVHPPSVSTFRAAAARPVTSVNMYGITETTVHVTARFLTVEDERAAGVSPIGMPMPHMKVRLMDEDLRPVPPGTVGEICVTGAGVASGYLRRPELTAERFVWLDDDGGKRRFYRSGDLARCNDRGELEYIGRIDDQVKIHGFRIEPGEIETHLEAMSTVAAAAVTVERNRAGEPILVGYFVPHGMQPSHPAGAADPPDATGEARRLRAALHDLLPRHMVPGRLVPVPALPRTASGKLDRSRLGGSGARRSDG